MRTDYYVIVTRLDKLKPTIAKCGRLWATHYKDADIEAGEYRDRLNKGMPLEKRMDKWYVVTAVPYSIARSYLSFNQFKDNRVTPEPKI